MQKTIETRSGRNKLNQVPQEARLTQDPTSVASRST